MKKKLKNLNMRLCFEQKMFTATQAAITGSTTLPPDVPRLLEKSIPNKGGLERRVEPVAIGIGAMDSHHPVIKEIVWADRPVSSEAYKTPEPETVQRFYNSEDQF